MQIKHTFVVLAYRESEYLENCIQSVLDQTVPSKVMIATSTPNAWIDHLAKKYQLEVIVRKTDRKGIGVDFNFALHCAKTELVTIAHQDDLYSRTYTEEMMKAREKYPQSLILFSDYYELKNDQKVVSNQNLKIKRILLSPLRIKSLSGWSWLKRRVLSFGCPICCPAVTFDLKKMPKILFSETLTCDVDWYAWEQLSRKKGKFIYIRKSLMGHRIHKESTTTSIIKENVRTKEDFEMFCKFWPKKIAQWINRFYVKSEASNEVES